MKTFKFYVLNALLIVALTSLSSLKARTLNDSVYTTAMEQTLAILDTATSVKTLQQCKNAFERTAQLDEKQWLPVYYVAYCSISSVYFNPQSDRAASFLSEAKLYLDKLSTHKQVDKSELATLKGFYYMALIASDSQTNGQKHFNDVINCFQEGMQLNPENPRPVCLLVFFNKQLPPFIQIKIDGKAEKEKAAALFGKERKNTASPYWGGMYLRMLGELE